MAAEVILRPKVIEDANNAFDWYEMRNLEAANRFEAEFDLIINLFRENPEIGVTYEKPIRAFTFAEFPFRIYYLAEHQQVHVLRCLHSSMHPDKIREKIHEI